MRRKVDMLEGELESLQERYAKLKESLKVLKKNYKKLKGKDGDKSDHGDGLTHMKSFKVASPK